MAEAIQATEPRLWIRRLAIFESTEAIETPIRDIHFHRGLNIIWGRELPDGAGTDTAHPVTLAGHSVGKTTLCRLIRYCLGENTFGNASAMARIRSRFPKGFVGMELVVAGRNWSVLKLIGHEGESKACEGIAIEELFDLAHKENMYRQFMTHLSESMMSGLQTNLPPNGDRPYEWRHLLAWLTRDQEARFQSLHEWRSPRSESDTPKFKKPKEHALYLMRLVLGLIHEMELNLSRQLEAKADALQKCEENIAELKREPNFRLQEHERILKHLLDVPESEALHIDHDDMASPAMTKRNELAERIKDLERNVDLLDERIAQKRIWQASYDEQRRVFLSVLKATEESLPPALSNQPEDEEIRQLRDLMGRYCTYAQIEVANCEHVKDRIAEQEKVVDLAHEREEERRGAENAQRRIIAEQGHQDHDEIIRVLNALRLKLISDMEEKQKKERQLAQVREELNRLNASLAEYRKAFDLANGRIPDSRLQKENIRLEELKAEIELIKADLKQSHASYVRQLQSIENQYDSLVKEVLSDSYKGTVDLPGGELHFGISEETGLAGEAVETLSLALADVAAMLCSSKGIGLHPGFLVHDSPREADLDRHIYNRYLDAIWKISRDLGDADSAPFQYIVTTTTSPTEELDSAIILQLQSHPPTAMLFGCLLKNSPQPEQLDTLEAGVVI